MSLPDDIPENIELVKEPTGLMTLLVLGWTAIAIFDQWDPNMYIYISLMIAGSLLSVSFQLRAIRSRNKMNYAPVYIYVLFFIGISAFVPDDLVFALINLELRIIEGLVLLPILIIWLVPMNTDQFFRLQKITREQRLKNTWKISVIIMYVVRFSGINKNFEFLVLLPMIIEPILLHQENKGKLPYLTLQIHKELFSRFSPQISLLKTVMLIQIAFISEFLVSKVWILFLMMFITAIVISLMVSLTLQFTEREDKEDEKIIEEIFAEAEPEEVALIRKERSELDIHREVEEGKDIGSKAYRLGKRIRTEVKKPKYNLHNILSTLKHESLTSGYVVTQGDLVFNSVQGAFNPPQNLVLFPIELAKFDYRRRDEVLLLGFNRPKLKKDEDTLSSIIKEIEKDEDVKKALEGKVSSDKFGFSIGDDHIVFGKKVFNLQTIVVKKEEWQKMTHNLTPIDASYDLSYTGFENIDDLQDVLTSIGDKWNEVREKIKLTAANFLAGLLGVEEAVFMGVDDLLDKREEYLLDEADIEDIEDIEDKN